MTTPDIDDLDDYRLPPLEVVGTRQVRYVGVEDLKPIVTEEDQ